MRSLVARTQETLIIRRHKAHVMDIAAVILAGRQTESFVPWLCLGARVVIEILLLVIVPAVLRYHSRRCICSMDHVAMGSEGVREFCCERKPIFNSQFNK